MCVRSGPVKMLEVVSPTNLSITLDQRVCWLALGAELRLTFDTHGMFDDEKRISFQIRKPEVYT